MKKLLLLLTFYSLLFTSHSAAQEVVFYEMASVKQVYGEVYEDAGLLPMNDFDMESGGYALYEAKIDVKTKNSVLEVENVCDFAAVYIDGRLQGTLTGENNSLEINILPGCHLLQLYAENIGRITYGPEILDNSKGLFGRVRLDGEAVIGWRMTPLDVKGCLGELVFESLLTAGFNTLPAFYKGRVDIDAAEDLYLDVSGWGMGEVWLNGVYMGSFWENEKQRSILLPAAVIVEGGNEIIVFELKNNRHTAMRLSPIPVFS